MRLAGALPVLLLAACSQDADVTEGASVECALGGAAGFAQDCTMQRAEADGSKLLVVRHPDGGFRRFELGVPGEGIVTADGVEQAIVQRGEGVVEVQVGADRYRLPVAE